ncbi:MAG: N-acetyltransferase [Candidatus Melainabacteria bacterium]|nr:MAG: N-acetyltransferase [Candidatus Melainabacteria bacterium]
MKFTIRKFEQEDKTEILYMMKVFYSSDAVSTNGSDEIFERDFTACVQDSPFLEGYVLTNNDEILGYVMLAKSFSTEFGKPCIWLEDLYLKPEHRGKGIIPEVIKYVENLYKNCILRLEVEDENTHAVYVYEKSGFSRLPYVEMKKDV